MDHELMYARLERNYFGQHEPNFHTILFRRTFATQHTNLQSYTFIMPVAKKQTRTDKLNAADAMAMAVAVAVHRRNNEARKAAARNIMENPENGAPAAAAAPAQQKQKRKGQGKDQLNEAKKAARRKAARTMVEHQEHGAPATAAPAQQQQKQIQKQKQIIQKEPVVTAKTTTMKIITKKIITATETATVVVGLGRTISKRRITNRRITNSTSTVGGRADSSEQREEAAVVLLPPAAKKPPRRRRRTGHEFAEPLYYENKNGQLLRCRGQVNTTVNRAAAPHRRRRRAEKEPVTLDVPPAAIVVVPNAAEQRGGEDVVAMVVHPKLSSLSKLACLLFVTIDFCRTITVAAGGDVVSTVIPQETPYLRGHGRYTIDGELFERRQ
jgi:hypothetical protein